MGQEDVGTPAESIGRHERRFAGMSPPSAPFLSLAFILFLLVVILLFLVIALAVIVSAGRRTP